MITTHHRTTPGGSADYWEGWVDLEHTVIRTRTTHQSEDDAWDEAADLLVGEWLR